VEFCNILESEELPKGETWIAYVDGSSTQTSSRFDVVLINPDKDEVSVAIKLAFLTTNNEVEYEAVLTGLSIVKELGARNLEIHSDSQVGVGHIQGGFETRGDKMLKYLAKVQSFQDQFDLMVITQFPRSDNTQADSLAWLGLGTDQEIETSTKKVRVLTQSSIVILELVMQIDDIYDSLD